MADLQNRVVVVTGGSAGVGRAVAEAFAREGAKVAVLARDPARLDETVRTLQGLGAQALSVPVDVADAQQVENAAQRVEEQLGPIDIWINDAMTTVFAPFKRMTPEDFRRVTEVTYLGFVYGTMAALKRMLPRDRGVIVQVGSALSDRSIPLQSAYCGAKHAIRGFTDSIRCELIHDNSNVHLTMVQLPGMNTPQFDWCKSLMPRRAQPVPPMYQPEIAAQAILYAPRTGTASSTSAGRPWKPCGATNFSPAGWTGTWPAPTTRVSRPRSRRTRPGRTICGSRSQGTFAPTAGSMRAPGTSASNSGRLSISAGIGAWPDWWFWGWRPGSAARWPCAVKAGAQAGRSNTGKPGAGSKVRDDGTPAGGDGRSPSVSIQRRKMRLLAGANAGRP